MTKASYHHGNLKNTILDEVLELLNYKSFDEISFRSISRNIGVVSSAPYNHFKDKKHLIKEVILLGEKKLLNVIERPYEINDQSLEFINPGPDNKNYRTFCGT